MEFQFEYNFDFSHSLQVTESIYVTLKIKQQIILDLYIFFFG